MTRQKIAIIAPLPQTKFTMPQRVILLQDVVLTLPSTYCRVIERSIFVTRLSDTNRELLNEKINFSFYLHTYTYKLLHAENSR